MHTAAVKAVQAGRGTASTLLVGSLESRTATSLVVRATSTQLALSVLRLLFHHRAPLRSSAGIPGSFPVFMCPCATCRFR